ncbi:FAD-binding oxidoreductase, partial [Mesorhizobium sp.]
MELPRQTDVPSGRSDSSITAIEQFRQGLRGELVLPKDAAYDKARRVWNGAIDKRPAAIVFCADPDDVVHAVTYARSQGCLVAVRSGGHNVAGLSVCDDGMVIDLSRMKTIAVDAERRIARAEAGLTLGELDAATQAYGLATTMGVNGDTGIAGLTLGGGFGKLGRKHGLSCDNLIAAEIVTADGQLLRTSATEHPDLFWALRGGGGNFGIVTRFEYRLHPIGPS